MTVSTQEAEEKRKQLLAKELTIKRNLSLVRKFIISTRNESHLFISRLYEMVRIYLLMQRNCVHNWIGKTHLLFV